jgi:hypothetical protein
VLGIALGAAGVVGAPGVVVGATGVDFSGVTVVVGVDVVKAPPHVVQSLRTVLLQPIRALIFSKKLTFVLQPQESGAGVAQGAGVALTQGTGIGL